MMTDLEWSHFSIFRIAKEHVMSKVLILKRHHPGIAAENQGLVTWSPLYRLGT